MARLTGLHIVIATAILQIQASTAAVIRNLETTTVTTEISSQVSTMADRTVPQDIIGQTTLPPILFLTSTAADTTDTGTDTVSDTDIDTSTDTVQTVPTENQTTPQNQPESTRELLSRSEPELDRTSTMADTGTMDGDTTLVSTDELVSVGTPVPEVGEHTVDNLVKIPGKVSMPGNAKIPSRIQEDTATDEIETVMISTSVPEIAKIARKIHTTSITPLVPTVKIPNKAQKEAVTIPTLVPTTVTETVSIPSKVNTVSIPQMVPEIFTTKTSPDKLSDSFVPPAVQIMAYVIDALWEEERKNLDDEYKTTEDVIERKEDWEDDDMSKPVFQTNVPIVNEESVPMRMHMDIIPQGFPEDLEGPMYYSHYYDDKDTKNDLEKLTEHPWGKDPDDIEDIEDVDNVKNQQHTKFFQFSDTFDKLVELHKNLAVYARNHDIMMFKGCSDRVTNILRQHYVNAAEQLMTVISMVSDEIDDESLDNSLQKFLKSLSESNSESSLALSNLPALHDS